MKPATCHLERAHHAKGLCKQCYDAARRADPIVAEARLLVGAYYGEVNKEKIAKYKAEYRAANRERENARARERRARTRRADAPPDRSNYSLNNNNMGARLHPCRRMDHVMNNCSCCSKDASDGLVILWGEYPFRGECVVLVCGDECYKIAQEEIDKRSMGMCTGNFYLRNHRGKKAAAKLAAVLKYRRLYDLDRERITEIMTAAERESNSSPLAP